MKPLTTLPLTGLALAAGLAIATLPASAQSTSSSTGSTQNAPAGTSGQLPPDSLPGKRQGAIGGTPVPQGSSGTSTEGTNAPTGQLPGGSLQQERQGVIGGSPVTQGGSGQSSGKQQDSQ
ncbi:hypothetical protein [Azospirillum endophyticum]